MRIDTTFDGIRDRVDGRRAELIGRIIEGRNAEIIELWIRRAAREFDYGGDHTRDELVDDFPSLLEAIGTDVFDWNGRDESSVAAIARKHGRERWKQDFELSDVVRDYQILRSVLIEFLCEALDRQGDLTLTRPENLLLNKVLDESIVASVETYSERVVERHQDIQDLLEDRVEQRTRQIRSLSQALIETEVQERERVARILHESVQQTLFAARLRCSSLAGVDPDDRQDLIEMLDEATAQTRDLAVDLDPPALKSGGLVAALRWLQPRCEERFGLVVALKIGQLAEALANDLSDGEQAFVLRFVQESLLNAAKHSESTEAAMHLWNCDRSLCVSVQDGGPNGENLVRAMKEDRLGFGLTGLVRTARLLRGDLTAETNETGTKVSVVFPVGELLERDESADEAAGRVPPPLA